LLDINNKVSSLPMWRYINELLYICITPISNIWFCQNSTPTMHHLLLVKVPNFSLICERKQ